MWLQSDRWNNKNKIVDSQKGNQQELTISDVIIYQKKETRTKYTRIKKKKGH